MSISLFIFLCDHQPEIFDRTALAHGAKNFPALLHLAVRIFRSWVDENISSASGESMLCEGTMGSVRPVGEKVLDIPR